MRNLRVTGRSLVQLANADRDALPLTATAWDTASDTLVCAFGPSQSRALIQLKRLRDDAFVPVAEWDAPCPLPSLPCDSVVLLHHFADTSVSCIVLAGGDIVLVRENVLPGEEEVEIVGSVDAGISAAAWSPDEELLAIATQADTFLVMSRDMDSIFNVTMAPDDVKVSHHVSVGWGKKETQFKGKGARALRDPTVPDRIDEGVLSPFDDRAVAISWRGDGAYVAVSTVEQKKRRMIRVHSRMGELSSVTEPVDGLEGALSWRPSGNLIAGIRRRADRGEVVFFERNGLRHGEFDLRLTARELGELKTPLSLQWSSDSSVLAVCYPTKVQLWTMGNYHYYLKQELVYPEHQTPSISCTWNPERALSIALATPYALQMLDFVSTTHTGSMSSPYDFGAVGVIDGCE